MDDPPHQHRQQDYYYGRRGDDDGVAEDFGDEDHLGSGPPPPLPPREGYPTSSHHHVDQLPSPTHYSSSPSGAVVGSRYRNEVDQERAGRFGGGRNPHPSSSDRLPQSALTTTNYESHFDANTVDETTWLNPVLRKEVESALSQVLPIPKYLQENSQQDNNRSPPPPTPHVQMMNSPLSSYNRHGTGGAGTSFPRVPTMTSGSSPGSLTTSLSAYLYQMEGGSPQGLRKDLIARLGSRQYNNSYVQGGGPSLLSGGGYQPPQHIDSQRHPLYEDRVHGDEHESGHQNVHHRHADIYSSSPQYQQSKYFQNTGNPTPSTAAALEDGRPRHPSGQFSVVTPARGGGYNDDYEDQTPPQPQYRRPSYGALRGGAAGGAQSFGSGAMRLNSQNSHLSTNLPQTTAAPSSATSSSYNPAAGRSTTTGRVVPNFDESP